MKRRNEAVGRIAAVLLVIAASMAAQDSAAHYSNMVSVDQYLMADRSAEVALAQSAAPSAISRDAKVLVLGKHGYETAVEGKNGWVCLVERGWEAKFDDPVFWNPKIRSPICFNPPAVHYVVPVTYKRAEMALAGSSKADMLNQLTAAYAHKQLPGYEPGGMSYMMSKQAYLTDEGDHNLAHLMFYEPPAADWGADSPGSPVMLAVKSNAVIPYTMFILSVGEWSDGSPAVTH